MYIIINLIYIRYYITDDFKNNNDCYDNCSILKFWWGGRLLGMAGY
jgi:hypothetical protein